MTAGQWAHLPAEPPGIAEWEDLLVRLEIAPRAMRAQVDVGAAAPAEAARVLAQHLAREQRTAAVLRAMADGAGAASASTEPAAHDEVDALLRGFETLRARSFAAVQRRGVAVWRWRAALGEGGEVSAYQLLQAAVEDDARALSALRQAAGRC